MINPLPIAHFLLSHLTSQLDNKTPFEPGTQQEPAMSIEFAVVKGLYMVGRTIYRQNKVDGVVDSLQQLDPAGEGNLTPTQLKAVISRVKTGTDADAVKTRALLLYVLAMHQVWEKDPAGTEKKLRKLKLVTTWNENQALAKLEMIVWSFYFGKGKKTLQKLKKQLENQKEVNAALEEILMESLSDMCTGEVISNIVAFAI